MALRDQLDCQAARNDYAKAKADAGEALTREEYQACRTAKGSYPKETTLIYWNGLPANLPILPHMRAIKPGSKGSSYGACGIRIDGTTEFIDAVLSRIKDLIAGEGPNTRLELARSQVTAVEIKGERKTFDKAAPGAECCYIRLHERGEDAKMCNAFLAAFTQQREELGL